MTLEEIDAAIDAEFRIIWSINTADSEGRAAADRLTALQRLRSEKLAEIEREEAPASGLLNWIEFRSARLRVEAQKLRYKDMRIAVAFAKRAQHLRREWRRIKAYEWQAVAP